MRLGMMSRQEAIGLSVPQWLVVPLSRGQTRTIEDNRLPYVKTLRDLTRGMAIAGTLGVTLVGDWRTDPPIQRVSDAVGLGRILPSRPYFGVHACDPLAWTQVRAALPAEVGLAYVVEGSDTSDPPIRVPGLADCYGTALFRAYGAVATTRNPMAALAALRADAAELNTGLYEEVKAVDADMMAALATQMAVLILSRPGDFPPGMLVLASDFRDEVVSGAFNTLGLRARWKKEEGA